MNFRIIEWIDSRIQQDPTGSNRIHQDPVGSNRIQGSRIRFFPLDLHSILLKSNGPENPQPSRATKPPSSTSFPECTIDPEEPHRDLQIFHANTALSTPSYTLKKPIVTDVSNNQNIPVYVNRIKSNSLSPDTHLILPCDHLSHLPESFPPKPHTTDILNMPDESYFEKSQHETCRMTILWIAFSFKLTPHTHPQLIP
jgi:hypothetical protein